MIHEFRAHRPHAYFWFALFLALFILLNALLIQLLQPVLLKWNEWMQHYVVFIVPWLLFLFLPSVFGGLFIYHALIRSYRFTIEGDELRIERINSRKEVIGSPRIFLKDDFKEFRFSDFEDNQYLTLVFSDKKNNLIIHRNTGEFEAFFEELKIYQAHRE